MGVATVALWNKSVTISDFVAKPNCILILITDSNPIHYIFKICFYNTVGISHKYFIDQQENSSCK